MREVRGFRVFGDTRVCIPGPCHSHSGSRFSRVATCTLHLSHGSIFFSWDLQISSIQLADIADVDLTRVGTTTFGSFSVEVVDPVADYLELL